MGERELTVRLENVNARAKETFAEIIRSVKGLELVDSKDHCSLLILEVGRDPEEDFRRINEIKESHEAKEIFLTAKEADTDLLIRALRTGVKEFFSQPLKREDVVEAFLKFIRKHVEEKETMSKAVKGKIFTVFGAKGGAGTSTIAVNLATGMAQLKGNPSVALVDMNLLSGDVPLFLNMKSVFNWVEVARNISRMDATYLMTVLQKHASEVHVLPAPMKMGEDASSDSDLLSKVERVLEIMRSIFDFVIIDGGQLLGHISTYLIGISNKVLLVTIPSLPGIINSKRLIDAFSDLGYPSVNTIVVMNRFNQKAGVSIDEVRKMLKRDIRWSIPNDYRSTMNAINTGIPLTKSAPKADVTSTILKLAEELSSGKIDTMKTKKSFFDRF
ncbi:MAG: AAA family ATPase [Smithella sp.]|nr:AAA family ATPase [Smithella sp.]